MNYDEHDKWFQWAAGKYILDHMHDDDPDPKKLVATVDAAQEFWRGALIEDDVHSPIEAIFLAFALFATDGYGYITYDMFPGSQPPPEFGTTFQTQAQLGKHRVDFLFICHYHGATRRLIVECDGHAFHERTKEQAARDKSRDRDFVKDGASVVRYTGSELYRDPIKCLDEVEVILSDLLEDMMAQAGVLKGRRK